MNKIFLLLLLSFTMVCCKEKVDKPEGAESVYHSEDRTSFVIQFADDEATQKLLNDSILYEHKNKIAIKEIQGLPALEIKTDNEFSDAQIDFEKLFGHTIDFTKSRYVSMKILVPKESRIGALKFNFKDNDGNGGGCGEIANNFYGHYDQWLNVAVDMQDLVPHYKSWGGDGNPLSKTSIFTLNPYNAHQADSSVIYVNNISLGDQKPDLDYIEPLVAEPNVQPNIPFTIDFDDEKTLQTYTAYRSFESSYQALSQGLGGNATMAVRLKGKPQNKFIAFLPKLHELTGHPVDFTKVEKLNFSYYVTEESDDFDGASLWVVTENWDDMLIDRNVYSDFKKGAWHDVSIPIKDLNLERLKGDNPVLPTVYELRLSLNYRPDKKNIEMWLDNFGWE